MEAAQIRGLAFASLADFTKPEPFWTIDNKIYSHALLYLTKYSRSY
jgi:hypothetical protein